MRRVWPGVRNEAGRRQAKQSLTRREKKRIKELERELRRRDKALAETAAPLALRKKLNALWGGRRGRMTSLPERRKLMGYVEEAVSAGARKALASQEVGLNIHTVQRWLKGGELRADRRPDADRPEPTSKLMPEERERIRQNDMATSTNALHHRIHTKRLESRNHIPNTLHNHWFQCLRFHSCSHFYLKTCLWLLVRIDNRPLSHLLRAS